MYSNNWDSFWNKIMYLYRNYLLRSPRFTWENRIFIKSSDEMLIDSKMKGVSLNIPIPSRFELIGSTLLHFQNFYRGNNSKLSNCHRVVGVFKYPLKQFHCLQKYKWLFVYLNKVIGNVICRLLTSFYWCVIDAR